MRVSGLPFKHVPQILTLVLGASFFAPQFSSPSYGQTQVDCPKSLAALDSDNVTTEFVELFKKTYAGLGCPIELEPFPGRRGIVQFNHKKVDGELFRIAKVEPLYQRDFVRSEVPLFNMTNSLWVHPKPKANHNQKIGFVLGLIWQEKYRTDKTKKSYHNIEKMYEAYNAGNLAGMLSSNFYVRRDIKAGLFKIPPTIKEQVSTYPVYHYLGSEYAPFMAKFSTHLKNKKPFDAYVESILK